MGIDEDCDLGSALFLIGPGKDLVEMDAAESSSVEILTESLKRAASVLEAQRVPYLLAGGLGCWARGGPPSSNDIDLMLAPADAERALAALESAGLRAERPPEHWLLKGWDGDVLIDLIFEPAGLAIERDVF